QVLTEEPAPPSALRAGVDPALEAICRKAMAREREDRFASMADFAEALGRWLGDDAPMLALPLPAFTAADHVPTQPEHASVTPPRASRQVQPSAPTSRRGWWRVPATAVALGLLLGATVAAWHWMRGSDHKLPETTEPTAPVPTTSSAQPQASGV